MQQISRSSILILSLLFLAFISSDARTGTLDGGWGPIKDINDPHVKEIAEFAVGEYNKQSKTSLKLEKVVKGEAQVVAGMNYRLVLKAKDETATNTYQAVVWEKAWLNMKNLTSFKPVKA